MSYVSSVMGSLGEARSRRAQDALQLHCVEFIPNPSTLLGPFDCDWQRSSKYIVKEPIQ
jgi:hypothetical protein